MEQGKPFTATESPLVDFDAICQKVRAAVEPARAHAVSLHDQHGEVLWLSESSMGPDEHNAVREALETFSHANGPPIVAYDLGDSRSAVLMRAINTQRALVGAVMMIMETRAIKQDERGVLRLMTPKLQQALSDFAGMRPPTESNLQHPAAAREPLPVAPAATQLAAARLPLQAQTRAQAPTAAAASVTAAAPMTAAATAQAQAAALARVAELARSAAQAKAAAATGPGTSGAALAPAASAPRVPARTAPGRAATGTTASVRMTPSPLASPAAGLMSTANTATRATGAKQAPPAVSPEIDRLHAALRKSPIALHVQRLVPLTKGSQMKRYEVLLRSKSEDAPNSAPQAMLKAAVENGLGSMIDRRVITELIGWLVHHPDVWQSGNVMFSVNLTTTALHDEHFIKFVELCLAKSSLPKGTIAFEVDVPTAVKLADKVAEVAAALHRLGCPLVLDDFGLRTECFDLLRLPGVRYVKLAPEITARMRTDKLSQAAITAVVQMARVLGMHTVAKRTETAAEQEWLTALGVDFVQSNAMSPSISIESLGKPARQKA